MFELSAMHQARSSLIAITVSVFARVALMISSGSAKAGNYTPLLVFHLSTGLSVDLERPLYCQRGINTLHAMGPYMGPTGRTHGKAKVTFSRWYSSKIVDGQQLIDYLAL